MKVFFLIFVVPVLVGAAEEGELCWEKCFKAPYNTESNRFKDIYADVLDLILDLKATMNLNNLTKVAYLVDTSVSQWHDSAVNPDIGRNTFHAKSSDYLFFFESILGQILTFGVDNAIYAAQFNERSAWGCEGAQCYPNNCNMTRAFRWLTPMESSPSSHCPNNMEAGCNLLGTFTTTLPCSKAPTGEKALLVAIVNGDFTSLMNPLDDVDPICPRYPAKARDQISACQQYFDHRYVIAVHKTSEPLIRKFISHPDNYRYLPVNLMSYTTLKNINTCLSVKDAKPCCLLGGGSITMTPNKCDRTEGPFGEFIADFNTHYALANSSLTIPNSI